MQSIVFYEPLQEIHRTLLSMNWFIIWFHFKKFGGSKKLVPHIPSYSLFLNIFLLLMHKKMTDLPCEVENRDTGWEEEEETKESERKYTAWEFDNLSQEL